MTLLTQTRPASLEFRFVTLSDADYILSLRQDDRYNAHLSPVTGTVGDQRRWIAEYKAREAAGQEAYYIIARSDGPPCGLVRLYDITPNCFTWGSWILDENKPPKAALESALRVYDIGFRAFGCAKSVFDVRRDNTRTLAFHRRFGAQEVGEDAVNVYFEYPRDRFLQTRVRYLEILSRQRPT